MKNSPEESPVTFIRLPEIWRKQAKQLAIKENRSLANMLRVLIQESIERRKGTK